METGPQTFPPASSTSDVTGVGRTFQQTSAQPACIKPGKAWAAGIFVFVAACITAILFHLNAEPPHRALCFDARMYFSDTQKIAEFFLSCIHGKFQPALLTERNFVESIITDGPVFPGLFGLLFALAGHVPTIADWKVLQIAQSVMHAGSAAMVFLITRRITGALRPALLSGLTWAFYPAAIFWSGTFYTETSVVFFLLLFMSLYSCPAMRFHNSLACGMSAGVIALLKPALIPAVAISYMSFWSKKRTLVFLVVGTMLVLAPWAIYTKITTGHARFTANRYPTYNLAMGADTEVDGCYVWPGAPLTEAFAREDASPLAFPLSQWQYRTADCLRMSVRKISCLFGAVSNDFRQTYFGLSPHAVNIWHQILAIIGFTGMFIFAAGGFRKCSPDSKRLGLVTCMFFAGHLVYILFTPTSRYGFTAMPLVAIFCGYALSLLLDKSRLPGPKALAAALAATGLWMGLLFWGEKAVRSGEPQAVPHRLTSGDYVTKSISLQGHPKPEKVSSVLLLIDADNSVSQAAVSVNGRRLPGTPRHIRYFSSKLYDQSWDLLSLGYPMGLSVDQFRQWRAVEVPVDLINWGGANSITLEAGSTPLTIYGDSDARTRRHLSFEHCCVNLVSNSPDEMDPRIFSPVTAAGISQSSRIKTQENAERPLPDSLRFRLAVALGEPEPNASPQPGTFHYKFNPEQFDMVMRDPSVNGIRTNKQVLKALQSTGSTVNIPDLPPSTHLRVRVTGLVRSPGRTSRVGVVVSLLPGIGRPALTLSTNPESLTATESWTPFVVEDVIPVSLLGPGQKQLYFAFYPGPWLDICGYGADRRAGNAQIKELEAQVSTTSAPEIYGKRIIYY